MGIVKQLPRTVKDAWKYLLEDKEIVRELGEDFVEKYLAVKKVHETMTMADRRAN